MRPAQHGDTSMFERLFGEPRAGPGGRRPDPARPVPDDEVPGPPLRLGARSTDLATWDFKVWGEVDSPFTLTWEEFKALPRKTVAHGHPLRDPLDEARHDLGGRARSRRSSSRAGVRPVGDPRARPLRAGLHGEPAAVACSTTTTSCWPTRSTAPARAGARLAAPPPRPEALLLEERQVDPRPRVPRPRHPGLLGALRLQQRRRPLEGRALQRVAAPRVAAPPSGAFRAIPPGVMLSVG